jgi:hypothetical protein
LKTRLALLLSLSLVVLGVDDARSESLFSLYPILQMTESYDDNITLSATHRLSDFISTGVEGFGLNFGGGGRTGSFQYDTVLQSYASHSQFNSFGSTNFITLVDQETLSPELSMYVNDSVAIGDITGGLLVGNTGAVSTQVAQAALTNTQTESNNFNVQFNRTLGERWTAVFGLTQNFYSTGVQTEYTQGGAISELLPKVVDRVRG